jgi:hypothetical protein
MTRAYSSLLILLIWISSQGALANVFQDGSGGVIDGGYCTGCAPIAGTTPTVIGIDLGPDSFVKLTATREAGVCHGGPIPGAGVICTESSCHADISIDIVGMGPLVSVDICSYDTPPPGQDPEIDRDSCVQPAPTLDENGDMHWNWNQAFTCGIPQNVSVFLFQPLPPIVQTIHCGECIPPGEQD